MCFLLTMFMTAQDALATVSETLATKRYVDQGLIYVYDTLSGKIITLENKVGDENSGLIKAVADLQNAVGTTEEGSLGQRVADLENNQLSAGAGITIDEDKKINIKGLESADEDSIYVYQDGEFKPLGIADDWSAQTP